MPKDKSITAFLTIIKVDAIISYSRFFKRTNPSSSS